MSDDPRVQAIREALHILTVDSLESSLEETLARPRGDSISDTFQDLWAALDSLVTGMREMDELLESRSAALEQAQRERDEAVSVAAEWSAEVDLNQDAACRYREALQQIAGFVHRAQGDLDGIYVALDGSLSEEVRQPFDRCSQNLLQASILLGAAGVQDLPGQA
jgi:ABC-type transporter Mla subunit MlaD